MRLPRRVPWAHIGELEQICSWIYADEEDLEAKTLATNRLSAWKAVTALPHALDSTLAILVAHLLDVTSLNTQHAALAARQAYAAAIIRMVNGLVDPLQVGAYARSIASIAAQLGLPPWLVELRHAATHEDLPSLELLREAARESLSWLLHNYFHPTLNSSAPAPTTPPLRPVVPLLKSYKLLMKIVTRDASLHKHRQDEIAAVMRDIERWIAEAKVSADLAVEILGWGPDENSATGQADVKEKWALEILSDALLEKGAIVPLSKKRRCTSAEPFLPTNASLALWTPLLMQLQVNHVIFPSVFTGRIVSTLLEDPAELDVDANIIGLDSDGLQRDATYDEYLARWATWAVRTWVDESDDETDLRKNLILQIAPALAPGKSEPPQKTKTLTMLLQTATSGFINLEDTIELLNSATVSIPEQQWKTHDLARMNERLQTLMSYDIEIAEPHMGGSMPSEKGSMKPQASLASGWTLLDAHSNWKSCPIGVYYSKACGV
ncbi:Las1-domain-containing protein [Paxillus ammoniavirescens]|nr:Las1-domain-containing protein [Paxillus ammoniavirescens]